MSAVHARFGNRQMCRFNQKVPFNQRVNMNFENVLSEKKLHQQEKKIKRHSTAGRWMETTSHCSRKHSGGFLKSTLPPLEQMNTKTVRYKKIKTTMHTQKKTPSGR